LNYIGVYLITFVVLIVVILILSLIFAVLGIASVSISANGFGAVNMLATIIMNFVLFFLVMPYMVMFQNRCMGLVYSLGS